MLCTAYDVLNNGGCEDAIMGDELILTHTSASVNGMPLESYVRQRYRTHIAQMSRNVEHSHVGWGRWFAQVEHDWLGTGMLEHLLPLAVREVGAFYRGPGLYLHMARTSSGRKLGIEHEHRPPIV